MTDRDPSVEEWNQALRAAGQGHDAVNHPSHYQWLPVEAIEITEKFDFLLGNCLKYIIRHNHKGKPLEDLRKAKFYLDRAIKNMEEQ